MAIIKITLNGIKNYDYDTDNLETLHPELTGLINYIKSIHFSNLTRACEIILSDNAPLQNPIIKLGTGIRRESQVFESPSIIQKILE